MTYSDIVPYNCVFIDADWTDFFKAAARCCISCEDRNQVSRKIEQLWMRSQNPNPVLTVLSVRTGLDLYLRVKNFPRGSEVIVSAINIPSIVHILHHHGLRVVSLDVNLESMSPKYQLLDGLVTDKTVALLLAHIYGRWFQTDPFIEWAKSRNIVVIEDCAEGFSGFTHLGNARSDLSLFSFGPIKYFTAFGGAVAKVKDPELHKKMLELYLTYPIQSQAAYLQKIMKYYVIFLLTSCPQVVKPGVYLSKILNIDHKKMVVEKLRGFPGDVIGQIRFQPCAGLLATMLHRMSSVSPSHIFEANSKAEYVTERLPDQIVRIGEAALVKNHWLFPILVDDPDDFVKTLNALGVDAYHGATQLNIVEPDNGNSHLKALHTISSHYPHEAKFLMDHVIYLPVNRTVPFYELDRICQAVEEALKITNSRQSQLKTPLQRVKLPSKL